MQLVSCLLLGGLAASVTARSAQHVGKKAELLRPRAAVLPERRAQPVKRQAKNIITTEDSKSMLLVSALSPNAYPNKLCN